MINRNTVIRAAHRAGKTISTHDAVMESVRIWLQHAEPGDKLGVVIADSGTPMKITEGPAE